MQYDAVAVRNLETTAIDFLVLQYNLGDHFSCGLPRFGNCLLQGSEIYAFEIALETVDVSAAKFPPRSRAVRNPLIRETAQMSRTTAALRQEGGVGCSGHDLSIAIEDTRRGVMKFHNNEK